MFLLIGPDSEAPNWWRSRGALGAVGKAKKFLASKASLRRYSNAVPCQAFWPDLVETETTPAPRPNSAEKVPVNTLNSRTDSTVGCTITVLKVYSLLSMPSTSQAFVLACEPRALKLEAPRGLKVEAPDRFSPAWPGVTPGTRYTSWAKLRPLRGSSRTARSSMTSPSSAESVRVSGASPTTSVASVRPPTTRVASMRARWFTCSTTPR